MKTWTKQQALTYTILLILLVADFSQSLLVLIYDNLLSPSVKEVYTEQFKFWIITLYWFILLGIPLIVLVIKLNQDQLQKMIMDRFYVLMLIIAGLLGLYSLPVNCFAIIALIYAVYLVFNNRVKFAVFDSSALRMILLIGGAFTGIIFCITSFGNSANIDPNAQQTLRSFLLEVIPGSIYEDAVYRGILYMFLKDLGLSEFKAIYGQAFLFWMAHISYLFSSPLTFWVFLPSLGLTLGYIAVRSKSLTPSTFAHVLYNVLVGFIVF